LPAVGDFILFQSWNSWTTERGLAGIGDDEKQVIQAFCFELAPNQKARVALTKHVGVARLKEGLKQGHPLPSAI
jgi:hypothetical protein